MTVDVVFLIKRCVDIYWNINIDEESYTPCLIRTMSVTVFTLVNDMIRLTIARMHCCTGQKEWG